MDHMNENWRNSSILLSEIPVEVREEFTTFMIGSTFEMIENEPAYFLHDWAKWVQQAFPGEKGKKILLETERGRHGFLA